jgi:hypothetical protein
MNTERTENSQEDTEKEIDFSVSSWLFSVFSALTVFSPAVKPK